MRQTIEEAGSGELIAYIVRHIVCENCSAPYTPDSVVVARRSGPALLWLATCPACQAEHTITTYDDQMPWEDLHPDNREIPGKITPAWADEWHSFLEDFRGDCYDLLAAE